MNGVHHYVASESGAKGSVREFAHLKPMLTHALRPDKPSGNLAGAGRVAYVFGVQAFKKVCPVAFI